MQKAEDDYTVVSVLLRSRKRGRYDAICFHCQQCVEKYVKARLVEAGVNVPKTHELQVLLHLALPLEPLWAVYDQAMQRLAGAAVLPRYPGMTSTRRAANEAVDFCRRFREAARGALGI